MSSSSTPIKSCLDILRRTDPRDTKKHLDGLATLLSNDTDVADELYQRVDVPLKVGEDDKADGRKFLLCEHNRVGDSHRSPWSNEYFPPLLDDANNNGGFRPSERLRSLELHFGEVFDVYRTLYYGKSSSVCSVYLWDKDTSDNTTMAEGGGGGGEGTTSDPVGFAGCFLIQNRVDDGNYWNSVHVVDAGRVDGRGMCTYELTSTILISITPPSSSSSSSGADTSSPSQSTTNVSGSITRQNSRECKVDDDDDGNIHIVNIGKFIEDVESGMRSELDSLYVQKTRTVLETIRKERRSGERSTRGQEHTKVLNDAVLAMAMNRKANLK
eukprot:CAMPEP_0181115802 /NCGR_PEP_ID=MMETSP1071-20121207/21620_1 /TAXON_ID=35127 /ORGANISM="Thalassiosira sp., Strain NH16" /LENGTH=326 /DNA_ID=CAMNT_0023200021 /DNA_START=181 /DNA_END=1161 /DNA_ORIENTATION=-